MSNPHSRVDWFSATAIETAQVIASPLNLRPRRLTNLCECNDADDADKHQHEAILGQALTAATAPAHAQP